MKAVGLLDTSVLLEILRVPGRSDQAEAVIRELKRRHDDGHSLLVPLGSVLETGNHIGRLNDGNERRQAATRFVDVIRAAVEGKAPFIPLDDVSVDDVLAWCSEFVDWVAPKRRELTDLSIKHAWERQCELHPGRRVYIWSLDAHLASFDRQPEL